MIAERGTWFENVVYWWNKRHEANVFFITYEEMQQVSLGIQYCQVIMEHKFAPLIVTIAAPFGSKLSPLLIEVHV